MATRLTADQVTQLAPDAASVAAGRKLASTAVWSESGASADAVWGYAKGSGKSPYETAVALDGPAYKCSCPSRKIPCKHVLGLLLLTADGGVPDGASPEWVVEWLASRAQRAEHAQVRAVARAESEADPEARERRRAKRALAISDGLDDLDRFLHDLMQQGLAAAREQPATVFQTQASRLVDAQAPAMAGRLQELATTLHAGGDGWQRRALEQAGMLSLAVSGWRRREVVPVDLAESLRTLVGWPRTTDELRETVQPEPGPWAVIGVRVVEQSTLRARRTWLLRTSDQRAALILEFTTNFGVFSPPLIVGTVVEGDLLPYPGRGGLRMLPAGDLPMTAEWTGPPASASATIEAAIRTWGAAVAADPFAERVPVVLAGVVPVRGGQRWLLSEPDGTALPLTRGSRLEPSDPWSLVALAGGAPVGIAAEFDGRELVPLSATIGGRVSSLQGEPQSVEQPR
jgi:hypothetical protein